MLIIHLIRTKIELLEIFALQFRIKHKSMLYSVFIFIHFHIKDGNPERFMAYADAQRVNTVGHNLHIPLQEAIYI